jgi:hypothetical protein
MCRALHPLCNYGINDETTAIGGGSSWGHGVSLSAGFSLTKDIFFGSLKKTQDSLAFVNKMQGLNTSTLQRMTPRREYDDREAHPKSSWGRDR